MNVLLTSVGRRTYLVEYFKQIEGVTVHAANSSDLSPAFLAADHSVVTPLIYAENYIPFLLEYCQANDIDLLVSLFDIDLPVLAAHRAEFEAAGVTVAVSDPEPVDICNDKWKTFQFLKNQGIATPKTWLALDEAVDAVREGTVIFPLYIKPRWGMGSLAIYQADNEVELMVLFAKCQRDIWNSYLHFEAEHDLAHAVLIQEKIDGQEYGMDIINDFDCNYVAAIMRKKLAMRSGETDSAQIVSEPVLETLGRTLAGTLKHRANLDIDVLMKDGVPYVIDMNARFGGGYPYSHMAGANLPQVLVDWTVGHAANPECLDVSEAVGNVYCKDIRMLRLR